ncbi:MAG: hypothetical protein LBN00_06995 [Oscillospiraceae bacterium]|jgi:type IV pilus assembly protein PilM|nr:hypothetical protein [Oscillospiraceae bacterium]
MAAKGLVIEFGERTVRVWNPRGGSFMFATPESSVTDGQLANPDALAATLTDELNTHGFGKTRDVSFVIPSSRVATREVLLPPVKESRVRDIVRANAADYFPVDLTAYHVAYAILGAVSDADSHLRVMVYAVPLSLLEGYFNLAIAADLRVRGIDYAGNAQYNVYTRINAPGVNLYVYINHSSSYLTFMSGETLILQRTLTFGDAEYELARLAAGIARSVDYFTSHYADESVGSIILAGSAGRLTGLSEAVAASTEHRVLYFDEVSEEPMPYLDCIGSALRPLDLLPQRFTQPKNRGGAKREASLSLGITSIVMLLLISCGLYAFSGLKLREAAAINAQIIRDVHAVEYAEVIHDKFAAYQSGAEAVLTVRKLTSSPNDNLTAFLSELERKMPSEILLLSASCARNNVVMNMTVPRKSDVARVMVQFRTFNSLQRLTVSSILEARNAAGAPAVSFTINCEYAPLGGE